ncbi:MAG: hypothetical protein Q8M94_05875 [Ignavibacteria bacterium]|nr:hypothetical protein [Ignavibacteria bacterium]
MREVKGFTGKLPVGFRLMEDEDFVYLYRGEKRVATFSAVGADPRKIEEAAERYLLLPKRLQ